MLIYINKRYLNDNSAESENYISIITYFKTIKFILSEYIHMRRCALNVPKRLSVLVSGTRM